MPVLYDKSGNRIDYTTVTSHGDSVCFDGYRFVQGSLQDFSTERASVTSVSYPDFRLLFTSSERTGIKTARASDDLIEDFFSIVEDPRAGNIDLTLESTLEVIDRLVELEVLTQERAAMVLAGPKQ